MQLSDLQRPDILQLLPKVDGIDPSDAGDEAGYLRVGGLLAMPVRQVACNIDVELDPEILDDSGTSLGTLCLTSKLTEISPHALTRWQYVAYLTDINAEEAGYPHSFKTDYVVIKSEYLQIYLSKYFDSAPAWGSFSHTVANNPISREHSKIVARPGIIFPTKYHGTAFSRYVSARNGFERFLRLYHTLELMFDFVFMKKVQKMNDDMDGFGNLSRSHGKSELERLKYIISEFCENWEAIAASFAAVALFESKAEEIFQNHSKDGNPLTQQWPDLLELCRASQTTPPDFSSRKICNRTLPYEKIVANIASYWIYRVRSSIAHSRVSEFLFQDSDEDFIVDFAEQLLIEVVRQVFSSSKLSDLVA